MILRVAARAVSRSTSGRSTCASCRVGISPEEIDAVARGGTGTWTPLESDLLGVADQLIDRYRIDDATWARLAEHLDEQQLMEVTSVVGTYTCLAMAFNSFGIELDRSSRSGLGRLGRRHCRQRPHALDERLDRRARREHRGDADVEQLGDVALPGSCRRPRA